jgi:hypothetical protein
VKKTEELTRANYGFRDPNGDSQYRDRLMGFAKKHYLGESA